jgi:GNAT superfamily N-acetyltransferase
VIEYRTFRNGDPPGLVRVWNQSFNGRGAAVLRGNLAEFCLFAKPYFDPRGLVLALDGGDPVGFALAGFGRRADGKGPDPRTGVLCALGVVPHHRRHGVGTELLSRAEAYLRAGGATTLLAGPLEPDNPFTFGLYGRADSAGFLDSDPLARPFLEKRGYRLRDSTRVLHRPLAEPLALGDARFVACRQRYEIHARPLPATSWWKEAVLGPIEAVEYRLIERAGGGPVARAVLWELETTFAPRGNDDHAVGVLALEVVPELRRRGLGKFLLAQILRHLQEQYFSLVEAPVAEGNAPALALAQLIGFRQVDSGRRFQK